jgi:hypothetical protein
VPPAGSALVAPPPHPTVLPAAPEVPPRPAVAARPPGAPADEGCALPDAVYEAMEVSGVAASEAAPDYDPHDAAAAGPPFTGVPAAGELLRREASVADRAQVEQDPVVRQTLRLFDGIVIDVQRRPVPAPSPTE